MLTQLYEGIIKSWKEDKGFGFIQPNGGGKDVFIHIRDLKHKNYRPQQGDGICYRVIQDQNGKTRAYDAFIKGIEISHFTKKTFAQTNLYKNQTHNINSEYCQFLLSQPFRSHALFL